MHQRRLVFKLALSFLVLLAAESPSVSQANAVYVYTGQPFAVGDPPNQSAIGGNESIILTFAAPITANLNGQGLCLAGDPGCGPAQLQILSFHVGLPPISFDSPSLGGTGVLVLGDLTTNGAGQIVAWGMEFQLQSPDVFAVTSSTSQLFTQPGNPPQDFQIFDRVGFGSAEVGSLSPGSWTLQSVPVPVAATIYLVGLGLIAFMGRRRAILT